MENKRLKNQMIQQRKNYHIFLPGQQKIKMTLIRRREASGLEQDFW